MVSSCCCSCCAIMPKAKPASVSRVPWKSAAWSRSSARPRTSAAYRRASAGGSSGRVGRSERGCSKASYRLSISGRIASRPPTVRSSHSSSWLPMCARSHTSGDISGECWAVRSGSSTQEVSSVVRSRAVAREASARSRSASVSVSAVWVSMSVSGAVMYGCPSSRGRCGCLRPGRTRTRAGRSRAAGPAGRPPGSGPGRRSGPGTPPRRR